MGSASRRRQLGQELKRLRTEAGHKNLKSAEAATGVSTATISRAEAGKQKIGERTIRDLCRGYGVGAPMVDHLVQLAKRATESGWQVANAEVAADWFRQYLSEEHEADTIRTWRADAIFGPLQTPEYIEALVRGSAADFESAGVDRALTLRRARQERMLSADGPTYLIVLSEAAVRYQVGGAEVMVPQLRQIIEMSERPNVVIQVLPFSAGAHPANSGSFTILEFADTEPTIYQEVYKGAVYPTGPEVNAHLPWVHDRLQRQALSPEATRGWLRRLVAEY